LTVDYQPMFSAITGRLAGAEALVRWRHPTKGTIEPTEFVAVAEQSGTIGKLGQFVLEEAMDQVRAWLEDGVVDDEFAIHVNVSSIQLASASFVSLVMSLARQHGVPLSSLVFEAREAALLGRNDDVDRTVQALRRMGVRFAIDNFGTGANALTVFGEVGADILKIDASSGLDPGALVADTRLLRAIVVLAHALELQVVAERVSSPELLERVRTAGCDQIQGNLLARPASGASLPTSTTR
jgi:EAL domain-containing protein (putative c-di-GMP-specific phosphodiesterase class I)